MTWRLFGVLLRQLPIDSRYATVIRDTAERPPLDPDAPVNFTGSRWGLLNYQVHTFTDLLRAQKWQKEDGEFEPRPTPLDAPMEPRSIAGKFTEEHRAMLEQVRKNRAWPADG